MSRYRIYLELLSLPISNVVNRSEAFPPYVIFWEENRSNRYFQNKHLSFFNTTKRIGQIQVAPGWKHILIGDLIKIEAIQ